MPSKRWIKDPALEGREWSVEEIDALQAVAGNEVACVLFYAIERYFQDTGYTFKGLDVTMSLDEGGLRIIATWCDPHYGRTQYRKYEVEIDPPILAQQLFFSNDVSLNREQRLKRLRALIQFNGHMSFSNVRYSVHTRPEFREDLSRDSMYRLGNRHKLQGIDPLYPDTPQYASYWKGYRSGTNSPEAAARRKNSTRTRIKRARVQAVSGKPQQNITATATATATVTI